ncbi:MAG: pyridoxamine kinase [Blautia sp.]|nr:pyridoxamine kinase [Blautia sp.]
MTGEQSNYLSNAAAGKTKKGQSRILLVNDLVGYGNVALSVMIPILTQMGYHVFNLPTTVISNTLDYGKFKILDTTEFMEDSLKVWEELGFSFDAIATGFIVSEQQMQLVLKTCREASAKGTRIFTDPIMADGGRLYNGMTASTVEHMRQIVSVADVIMPNYTEACYLTETAYTEESLSKGEINRIIDRLIGLGTRSAVITSCLVEGEKQVVGYDAEQKDYFYVPYQEIPIRFPGTGDIFSSVLVGTSMKGETLAQAARRAAYAVQTMIERNEDLEEKYKGIPVEMFWDVLE